MTGGYGKGPSRLERVRTTSSPTEIHDLDAFIEQAQHVSSLRGWFIQSVDLSGVTALLENLDVRNAVFLGCTFADGALVSLTSRGALVFPALPGLPFDAYRSSLYNAKELFSPPGSQPSLPTAATTPAYEATYDGIVYGWYNDLGPHPDIAAELAMTLHDHAIGDALAELPHEHEEFVGIMGGHAVRRGTAEYAAAADLARRLAQGGHVIVTGGGPGAMEAANLGASLAAHPESALGEALTELAQVPDFRPSIDAWARAAFGVAERWPAGERGRSIGIPTWFYGHEPPNVFATDIAKFFNNALREDTLLHRCRGGIVVLPGAAGTTQEVFQATTWNYYASDEADIMPLVLVNSDHWQRCLPVWPLLQALSRDRMMGRHIHLVDHVDEALAILQK